MKRRRNPELVADSKSRASDWRLARRRLQLAPAELARVMAPYHVPNFEDLDTNARRRHERNIQSYIAKADGGGAPSRELLRSIAQVLVGDAKTNTDDYAEILAALAVQQSCEIPEPATLERAPYGRVTAAASKLFQSASRNKRSGIAHLIWAAGNPVLRPSSGMTGEVDLRAAWTGVLQPVFRAGYEVRHLQEIPASLEKARELAIVTTGICFALAEQFAHAEGVEEWVPKYRLLEKRENSAVTYPSEYISCNPGGVLWCLATRHHNYCSESILMGDSTSTRASKDADILFQYLENISVIGQTVLRMYGLTLGDAIAYAKEVRARAGGRYIVKMPLLSFIMRPRTSYTPSSLWYAAKLKKHGIREGVAELSSLVIERNNSVTRMLENSNQSEGFRQICSRAALEAWAVEGVKSGSRADAGDDVAEPADMIRERLDYAISMLQTYGRKFRLAIASNFSLENDVAWMVQGETSVALALPISRGPDRRAVHDNRSLDMTIENRCTAEVFARKFEQQWQKLPEAEKETGAVIDYLRGLKERV